MTLRRVPVTGLDSQTHRNILSETLNQYVEIGARGDWVKITGTSYTADRNGPRVILVDDDTAAGAVTITLPAAARSESCIFHIKKLGSTGNVVIDGNGSETIDGATTHTLTFQYEAAMLHCDGSDWWIV